MSVSHDHVPEFPKKAALERLCEKISEHLLGGAMLHVKAFELDSVLDKEAPAVDVLRVGSSRSAAVLLEPHRALVVLVKNVLVKNASLGFLKMLRPDGVRQVIARAN